MALKWWKIIYFHFIFVSHIGPTCQTICFYPQNFSFWAPMTLLRKKDQKLKIQPTIHFQHTCLMLCLYAQNTTCLHPYTWNWSFYILLGMWLMVKVLCCDFRSLSCSINRIFIFLINWFRDITLLLKNCNLFGYPEPSSEPGTNRKNTNFLLVCQINFLKFTVFH